MTPEQFLGNVLSGKDFRSETELQNEVGWLQIDDRLTVGEKVIEFLR